jgi:hypothetical protein
VTTPWQASPVATYRGTVNAHAKKRSFTVATALDGTLNVTLRAPAKAKLSVDVYAYATRVGRAATTLTSRTRTIQTTVCGTRSYRITVGRLTGSGTFSLAVTKP